MATTNATSTDRYSISECAARSGFSQDTLRYYEKVGLIGPIGRTTTGQRRFTDSDLEWLGTLKCLRDTGMPIEQMCRFAELVRAGDHTIGDRILILEQHRQAVDDRIADFEAKRDYITGKIDHYKSVR